MNAIPSLFFVCCGGQEEEREREKVGETDRKGHRKFQKNLGLGREHREKREMTSGRLVAAQG